MTANKISIEIRFAFGAAVIFLLIQSIPLISLAKVPDYQKVHFIDLGKGDAVVGCSPDQALLDRLDRMEISYSRTDQEGVIEMNVDRTGFGVTTSSTK
jgi:beta-lactamase superfamily II metal-dependent hydrolase